MYMNMCALVYDICVYTNLTRADSFCSTFLLFSRVAQFSVTVVEKICPTPGL